MRYLLTSLLLLLTLVSCQTTRKYFPLVDEEEQERKVLVYEEDAELSRIIWDFTTELKYDKRLHLEQSYLCVGPEQSTLHLEFITQSILEMCDARQLLVHVVEGLLDRINAAYPSYHLSPYPLTANQLNISIIFESFYVHYDDPFYIGWITLQDGMAYYYAYTVENRDLDLWHTRNEAYFQSRLFAKQQQEAEAKYKAAHPVEPPSKLKDLRYQAETTK